MFFVFDGTAANSRALSSLCESYHGIICHESAHVETDECGTPEFFSHGTKVQLAPGHHGKLAPTEVETLMLKRRDIHHPKPRALSISSPTELETIYHPSEIGELMEVFHDKQLAPKMRFLSAPWCTSLASGVWLENARTANTRAKQLEAGIRETGIAEILYPVEANSVFLKFPDAIDRKVRDKG